MAPSAPLFWRALFIPLLTVCALTVGNTVAAARDRGDTNFAENLFIGVSNACHTIMKTYSSDSSLEGETKKLRIIWYGPSGPETFPLEEVIEQINVTTLLTHHDKTVITIHGFNDQAESDIPLGISEAYLVQGKYNVILLDSSEITTGQYVRAAFMSQLIGKKLAIFLSKLVESGIPAEGIHLIGISLGAQIAGWAGRIFKKRTNKTISRITGLDPAGPCFSYTKSSESLNENDADFVDIIHVNKGIEGILEDVGHVDFYVNGGGPNQPGCTQFSPGCSHQRAGVLYMESFDSESPFAARKCDSWDKFKNNKCNNNDIGYLGFNTPKGSRGKFYLRTKSDTPFSLGMNGAKPSLKKTFLNFFNFL